MNEFGTKECEREIARRRREREEGETIRKAPKRKGTVVGGGELARRLSDDCRESFVTYRRGADQICSKGVRFRRGDGRLSGQEWMAR